MKKFIALFLVLAWILCLGGCKTSIDAESTDSTITDSTTTEGILDGGFDIGVDADTDDDLVDQDDNNEILGGVLDGGADIGVDATP